MFLFKSVNARQYVVNILSMFSNIWSTFSENLYFLVYVFVFIVVILIHFDMMVGVLCEVVSEVSRARDDRFWGPEFNRNSKRREVVVSCRRNTCLWEAINTNIQIFTNLRPRLARVSQWLGRCLAAPFGPPGPLQPSGQDLHGLLSRSKKSVELCLVFQCVLVAAARGAPSEICDSAGGVPELRAPPHIIKVVSTCPYIDGHT